MKRIIIIPVEGNIQIIIETEIENEELESADCLLCTKIEVMKMVKQELLKSGIEE